jgi:hypothetical protein
MAVRVVEIQPTAVVIGVDAVSLTAERVGPIRQPPLPDALEDRVKFGFADQKGEMARLDGSVGRDEIQRGFTDPHDGKMPYRHGRRQPEHLHQECGGLLFVVRHHDGVVETDCHRCVLRLCCAVKDTRTADVLQKSRAQSVRWRFHPIHGYNRSISACAAAGARTLAPLMK